MQYVGQVCTQRFSSSAPVLAGILPQIWDPCLRSSDVDFGPDTVKTLVPVDQNQLFKKIRFLNFDLGMEPKQSGNLDHPQVMAKYSSIYCDISQQKLDDFG